MKVLRAETAPPSIPFVRQHSPSDRPYAAFRPCLRWEFGFTCAFCLLHETDYFEFGAEQWGILTIEHLERQETSPQAKNKYANCYYACRHCNIIGRKMQPRMTLDGRRLLDPSETAWAEHFVLSDDRLTPIHGDGDAQYTEQTYLLNFPSKVFLRKKRREVMRRLAKNPLIIKLRQIATEESDEEKKNELLAIASGIEKELEQFRNDALRYVAIPADADSACKCHMASELKLPPEIERQTQNI